MTYGQVIVPSTPRDQIMQGRTCKFSRAQRTLMSLARATLAMTRPEAFSISAVHVNFRGRSGHLYTVVFRLA